MILSTRRAVFIGDLRSRVSWPSIVNGRRVMTRTPTDRAIGLWAYRAAPALRRDPDPPFGRCSRDGILGPQHPPRADELSCGPQRRLAAGHRGARRDAPR